ncbi:MAG: helix-turn-helix domain-containing protein [Firmicutes bacterium]|nr:helix-turn-helix domain-containing protein [Bacillota bacterium]
MNFEKIIKELREQNNYSQSFVAKKLGIRQSSYSKYEAGKSRPEYENLVKLARLYDVSIDCLLENELI